MPLIDDFLFLLFFQANNFDGLTLEVWSQYSGDTKE